MTAGPGDHLVPDGRLDLRGRRDLPHYRRGNRAREGRADLVPGDLQGNLDLEDLVGRLRRAARLRNSLPSMKTLKLGIAGLGLPHGFTWRICPKLASKWLV